MIFPTGFRSTVGGILNRKIILQIHRSTVKCKDDQEQVNFAKKSRFFRNHYEVETGERDKWVKFLNLTKM